MRFCWSHAFHYRATTLVALSKWKVGDWSHWFPGLPWYIYIYSQFFENHPNEICSHLSEKASKVGFFKPEKLQSHSNEGKGEEGKRKRREGKERKKKAMPALPVFIKKPCHANGPFGDIWITWPSVRPSILSDVHYLLVSRGDILHSSAHAF